MKLDLASLAVIAECITRPVGRVRIETEWGVIDGRLDIASPGRLAGCGLKLLELFAKFAGVKHHPAGWPGAD